MDGHWNQLQACIEDKETQLANHRPNHYSLLLLHRELCDWIDAYKVQPNR